MSENDRMQTRHACRRCWIHFFCDEGRLTALSRERVGLIKLLFIIPPQSTLLDVAGLRKFTWDESVQH